MNFKIYKIDHRFLSKPTEIEVHLALLSDKFKDQEAASITVILQNDNLKELTLSAIEEKAILRAKEVLGF